MGKSEQRELTSRIAIWLFHLLKWKHQPERRSSSWEVTIQAQRRSIARRLGKTPSLKALPTDAEWLAEAWDDAISEASKETGIEAALFEKACPWMIKDILLNGWLPR